MNAGNYFQLHSAHVLVVKMYPCQVFWAVQCVHVFVFVCGSNITKDSFSVKDLCLIASVILSGALGVSKAPGSSLVGCC